MGQLHKCDQEYYDEVTIQPVGNLFIHKHGFSSIVVRAPEAQKKTHCWRLRFLEIIQYDKQQGGLQRVLKNTIVFNGEMIFTLLKLFNQRMGEEIK